MWLLSQEPDVKQQKSGEGGIKNEGRCRDGSKDGVTEENQRSG